MPIRPSITGLDQDLLEFNHLTFLTAVFDAIERKKLGERLVSHGRSIEERPQEVKARKTFGFGYFEADTVLSGKRRGQAVTTFVERPK